MKVNQQCEEVLLNAMGEDQFIEIDVDHQTEWMRKILTEVQEDVADELREQPELIHQARLHFKGDLQKQINSYWREHALLVGELEVHFWTQCVKSGELMIEKLELDIQAVFINESLKKEKSLEESDTLALGGHEYDLYFYQSGIVRLSDVLHEQVFLNKNPYPTLE